MILTIMMVVMLTLEMAVISLISIRGLGEEGILMGQGILAKRGAETAMSQLEKNLYTYLQSGKTPAQAQTAFASGGTDDIEPYVLQTNNPDGGTSSTGVTISAWVSARRGVYYQIAGRSQSGGVDYTMYRWVKVNPCGGSPAGLVTIVTGENAPGSSIDNGMALAVTATMEVSPVDGRVYFGENANPGSFWTWKDGVLSTLVDGESKPGSLSTMVAPDGRVFFGENSNPGSFWTWKEGTGLSTILAGETQPNWDHCGHTLRVVADDGRIFFGENAGSGSFWTWHPDTGLSTLVTGRASPGIALSAVNKYGRVAFGEWNASNGIMWTWAKDTGLSTIGTTFSNPGYNCSAAVSDEGTVFFGESTNPGARFYAYKNGTLTNIIPAASSVNPSNYMTYVTTDGRIFFGENRSPGYYWTWKNGVLTTLINRTHNTPARWFAGKVARDNRFYWGSWGPNGTGGFWTWKDSTGMSTINTSMNYLGTEAIEVVPSDYDNRVYMGGWNYTGLFSWKENGTAAGSLSTILLMGAGLGADGLAVSPDGRVFFTQDAASGKFWTWKNGVLSTIISGVDWPGAYATKVAPDGRIYFGQRTNPGNLWTWKDPGSCNP